MQSRHTFVPLEMEVSRLLGVKHVRQVVPTPAYAMLRECWEAKLLSPSSPARTPKRFMGVCLEQMPKWLLDYYIATKKKCGGFSEFFSCTFFKADVETNHRLHAGRGVCNDQDVEPLR